MKILLFGASGMIGQSVLRECLLDPGVANILSVGRTALGKPQSKFHEVVHKDLSQLAPIEPSLQGFDACIYCLGVTAAGRTEKEYTRMTHDLTLSVARTVARLNPGMTFVYISAQGADSTEKGGMMWARVKGKTENDLLRLPFKSAYMFRPGLIQPMNGIKSKTTVYNIVYTVFAPFIPLLVKLLPRYATTSERLGRAMLRAAKRGHSQPILESLDINAVGTKT